MSCSRPYTTFDINSAALDVGAELERCTALAERETPGCSKTIYTSKCKAGVVPLRVVQGSVNCRSDVAVKVIKEFDAQKSCEAAKQVRQRLEMVRDAIIFDQRVSLSAAVSLKEEFDSRVKAEVQKVGVESLSEFIRNCERKIDEAEMAARKKEEAEATTRSTCRKELVIYAQGKWLYENKRPIDKDQALAWVQYAMKTDQELGSKIAKQLKECLKRPNRYEFSW